MDGPARLDPNYPEAVLFGSTMARAPDLEGVVMSPVGGAGKKSEIAAR